MHFKTNRYRNDTYFTLLTQNNRHDKMYELQSRAYSSMVEQWPFKPLVLGSSPSTLTRPEIALLTRGGYFC